MTDLKPAQAGFVYVAAAHGKTGFLCSNVEECISAIAKVPELDRYTCRQYVQAHFSMEAMTDGYEEVYWQILQQRFAKNAHHHSISGLSVSCK